MRTNCSAAFLVALPLALALPAPASAHEVLHEVRRGNAVALHAWFPDGESLAYVPAEVYSPADAAVPYWKGRTDRNGWLAFVPDAAGKWRVRILDSTGHGLDTSVDVRSTDLAGNAETGSSGSPSAATAVLRPVVGVLLVAGIFGFLWWLRGRRRSP